ncbi:nitroreductase/quinone reductase family protein [Mycolicibacterium holsaticum]|uniref:nitroreductase/quinone reductase family protein n=1 Tax=Mycolicibacterium holsaticum TaxID=152142 RepID=UPI001C7CA725|nr:nitroreductase/quinone reductase family protein [Mycolicibacterium holsaticum]QZA10565.1 nitroreductase family deazaflavin-dependent oxidoreductase [Mycolicibacterium holsaticum DSM 44478 = JCM 12374]UNC11931.1 nitroreductase family deazaflavin-dependent oxidoreductase [Mycolicibacterium holsaticum DSM 44478 = JCM 12374]
MADHERLARQSNRVVRRWPRAQRRMSRIHARLYRASGGRFAPRWFAGAPVMVLETVGRRSGEKRSAPVLYLRDGDALVVMAANAGSARTPAWWLNLKAAGSGEAVVGRQRIPVRPRELAGAERDRLLRQFVEMYPQAEHYPRFTERPLPLIALEPTMG